MKHYLQISWLDKIQLVRMTAHFVKIIGSRDLTYSPNFQIVLFVCLFGALPVKNHDLQVIDSRGMYLQLPLCA